jgi:ferredoxin
MVKIDKNKCIGCGACEAVCPAGFEIKNSKASIKNPKAPCIKEGAEACPVNAIIIGK